MPWAQILKLVKAGGPKLVVGLTMLAPMLKDTKTRAFLLDAAKNMPRLTPTKRLLAKVEATVAIAEGMAKEADDSVERERADGWARRGRNISLKLNMPMHGAGARRANRKEVSEQLAKLQQEMTDSLGMDQG
jgi:hypothetical protein